MNSERIAEKRAIILRPIIEAEKKGLPVSKALEDAAWELGLSKSHTWSGTVAKFFIDVKMEKTISKFALFNRQKDSKPL